MKSKHIDLAAQSFELLFPQDRIQQRIRELGRQISDDYFGKRPVLLGVLKGCIIFLADLMRVITIPTEVDFVGARSYGSKVDPGQLVLSGETASSLKGRQVLLVEAVVDTGRTAHSILEWLKTMEPASVEIVTLLNKKGRRELEVSIKYAGFEIGNDFVIGYGLDHDQLYRNLPFIGKVIDTYGR